ncbi:MAG: hypothetical protein JXB26_19540 [Candidatus Aminicenantes bacterium]|nr:hypothetical protein [Candidatus Aminicenantes bacterium]
MFYQKLHRPGKKNPLKNVDFIVLLLLIIPITAGFLVSVSQENSKEWELKAADIFKNNCTRSGCHGGPSPTMGLNLEPENFVRYTVNKPSSQMPAIKLVDPQNPDQSYLFNKIKGSENIKRQRMPLFSKPLTEEEIQVIKNWILNLK